MEIYVVVVVVVAVAKLARMDGGKSARDAIVIVDNRVITLRPLTYPLSDMFD